ncbi:MAG: HIT family protein [Phaeodactylibacter sp.]|nr:HIT family protein [Phaeodactylibacter sp.]MCB9273001.1 HIT family protein [Lewinellaceae bacterium]
MTDDCIFCKIIEGSIPAVTVYEDDKVIAFMDIMPINPGHVLAVPKAHFRELNEMDEETGAHLFRVGMRIDRALRRSGLRVEGTNLLQNNGRAAFQEVPHVHLHIIPRYEGDGMKVRFGQEKAAPEQLREWAGLIKSKMER